MTRLATRAELDKLSGTLAVEPARLEFLEDMPADQLRGLRVAIYEQLFVRDRDLYRQLAWVAARLPTQAALVLAQRVGPLLTARVAAEMPAGRALRLVLRCSTEFLADVCAHLDPRRTHELIRLIPVERVVGVVQELVAREDYMTISRFVDFFDDTAIRTVTDQIEDEAVLVRIVFYMGSKNRLDHLMRILPRERVERVIARIEDAPDELLQPFLAPLMHVSYALKRDLGDIAAAKGEPLLTRYVRATDDQGLWPDVLPVVAAMSETARQQVVNLAVLREPAVQAGVVAAADAHDLWGIVLPLVRLMDDANREAVAAIVVERPPATLENACDAALMGEGWEELLDLVRRMPAPKREQFGAIVRSLGEVDPELVARLARRGAELGVSVPSE